MKKQQNNRVGLAVMRIQPLHLGHCQILSYMICQHDIAILCLGSAQKSREEHDPWTVEERITMVKNVYGDRIKIVPVNDLGAKEPTQWTDYLFEKFSKIGMKLPTDIYTGSVADSFWYRHCFYYKGSPTEATTGFYYQNQLRHLHIVERSLSPIPPATDVRSLLAMRSEQWKEWVPAVNHAFLEETYPEEFRIPLPKRDEIIYLKKGEI